MTNVSFIKLIIPSSMMTPIMSSKASLSMVDVAVEMENQEGPDSLF